MGLRKFAAILLVGILLFDSVGYRALNRLMQYRASQQLELRLDRQQYDESQLISIKVPTTHLAYYNNSTTFERVDGQIEINGVICQYVKRRIYNDSLELLCIPNHKAMQLRAVGKDRLKLIADLEQSPDYYIVTHIFRLKERAFSVLKQQPFFLVHIPFAFLFADERPPDLKS